MAALEREQELSSGQLFVQVFLKFCEWVVARKLLNNLTRVKLEKIVTGRILVDLTNIWRICFETLPLQTSNEKQEKPKTNQEKTKKSQEKTKKNAVLFIFLQFGFNIVTAPL